MHKNEEVYELLQEMKIGTLYPGERSKKKVVDLKDPFSADPSRHPALRPASERPFNAEPPPELLAEASLTPNDLFFVRNHMAVPQISLESYRIVVTGPGITKPLSLTLEDVKKFPKHSVAATLQCTGNRRTEMMGVKPVKGLKWGIAAISSAQWAGARLVDVLASAGV